MRDQTAILATLSFFLSCITAGSEQLGTIEPQNISGNEAVVALFGDVHENFEAEEKALIFMREHGVTHVIGLGDFILYGKSPALKKAVKRIAEVLQIPRDQIFLFPGNWEHTQNDVPDSNAILDEYGRRIVDKYDSVGEIAIGNDLIWAGHFPQHKLPEEMLPPSETIKPIMGQITIIETIERNHFPPRHVVFEVFAHTHVGGAYYDSARELWIINPGDVEKKRKRPEEPQAFAIWSQHSGKIEFINISNGKTIIALNLNSTQDKCRKTVCTLRSFQ